MRFKCIQCILYICILLYICLYNMYGCIICVYTVYTYLYHFISNFYHTEIKTNKTRAKCKIKCNKFDGGDITNSTLFGLIWAKMPTFCTHAYVQYYNSRFNIYFWIFLSLAVSVSRVIVLFLRWIELISMEFSYTLIQYFCIV